MSSFADAGALTACTHIPVRQQHLDPATSPAYTQGRKTFALSKYFCRLSLQHSMLCSNKLSQDFEM